MTRLGRSRFGKRLCDVAHFVLGVAVLHVLLLMHLLGLDRERDERRGRAPYEPDSYGDYPEEAVRRKG